MTPAIVLLFCILAVMVVLFLTEKLPLDLTAFLGLIALALAGYVSPHEVFSGFSSPVVITMICMFFLSAALRETGTAERMADLVHRIVGNDERRNLLAVMLVASFFSAFMNNIAAAALLLPAVMSIAAKGRISPSLLLMPLSFATLLGGMSTLIGTPPNLLASHSLLESHLAPLKFLEFLPFGLISILAGSAFFFYLAPRLLPAYKPAPSEGGGKNLAATYRLFERLFTVRLRPGSALVGKSLAELDLGRVLGAQVISIRREGGDLLAPSPSESVRPSDVLVLGGRSSDLDTLGRFAGIKVQPLSEISPTFLASQLKGAVVEVIALKSPDDTLAAVGFHSHFGCLAVAVDRGAERYFSNLSALSLRP